ncbi:MAG TPA: hypothetical protein PLL66_08085, partial [Bacteroidales bacterium]|nr:hypothetical protein [Bacteroidales bacterium]
SIELYDTYESIRVLYVKNLVRKFKLGKLSEINKFKADKITIKALETFEQSNSEEMQKIKEKVREYEDLKVKYYLSNQSIEKRSLGIFQLVVNSLIIILCLPAFIYGLINNLFAYFIPKMLVLKIKDKQFHSSIKFGWAVFVIPLIYAIQILIVALLFPKLWIIIAYAVSLPVFGLIARVISEWINILFDDWKLLSMRNLYNSDYHKLKNLHKDLIQELDLIITHWNRKP